MLSIFSPEWSSLKKMITNSQFADKHKRLIENAVSGESFKTPNSKLTNI